MDSTRAAVLVVDDDVDTCANLADILTDCGYRVDVAHDGQTALEMVRQTPYDIALLDLKMPGMDGLTLYREIRNVRAGTVAIIVSAYASSETADSAVDSGAWKVLSKPVDFSRLLPLLGEAAKQPLVMVVDDDSDLCASLWAVLREHGYRVCLAHDRREAADRLRDRSYRAVLIDLKLREEDGDGVFQLVRRDDPDARVILITAARTEMQAMIEQLLAAGADEVCYKPFDVPALLATLERLASQGPAH